MRSISIALQSKAKGKGADFPELIRNLGRNLAQGWVGTLSAVLERTV
jgi:hypothetical protein